MSCTIRSAMPGDIEQITRIYAHHVMHGVASFEEVPPDAAEMMQRMEDIAGRSLPYLAAVRAGILVGYAYAAPYKLRSAYRFTVENSIYIDATCHRQGIGAALLAELIAECETLGLRQMLAVIGGGSEASVALHGRHGFKPAGRLASVGYKFGKWHDIVLMTRPLGAGAETSPIG